MDIEKNLFILAFDQRSSLKQTLFGSQNITKQERRLMCDYKKLVFEGFLSVWKKLVYKESLAVLVDEEFGSVVIKLAKRKKIKFALSQEKSGLDRVAFEYGNNFREKIKKINPDFVKILVRYNPRQKQENKAQLKRLKIMSEWCWKNHYIFLVELLVPPTERDLKRVRGFVRVYDEKIRPGLAVKAIKEFYNSDVYPDIWKIEALSTKLQWHDLLLAVGSGKKGDIVKVVMLGRNASVAQINKWILACPKDRVSGFAIGRTIWLRSILDLHAKKVSRLEATRQIGENYFEFIKLWEKKDK
ncbi:hypothetical protein COV56_01130 [Candidatus Kuenenbacteria bacterium CG11_big_fil_rev_8_21_14_0_20_37_9]|uniref:DUF2090 domain-containing protein n=1 Tax=Candidatus Kuenenbacteria bacterium CG08_land_8_20_14_0_20_37_23 TaxID=1974617 RepID=A0A2M6XTH1_9BACT|nr:MAG: hypothetical protein COV56_01130 [Candidatus Kuenenbacteria bacterium CG11_big_fil_rev_8_21_14_0_20_37_9]PIU10948.1 MAG: hypothetical protein COT27_00445 [Candidatus Kuenenbacteria bacterium CG08_land_8_20_14_0_20_37_23]